MQWHFKKKALEMLNMVAISFTEQITIKETVIGEVYLKKNKNWQLYVLLKMDGRA